MIKSGYFEVGTVVLLENESNFSKAKTKLNKTIDCLISQTKVPVRIGVLAIECSFKRNLIKEYLGGLSEKLTAAGVVSFDFTYCINKELSFKAHLVNEYSRFIDKQMNITIYGKNGKNSKSKLKVSHFATINAGSVYDNDKYYEEIKNEFLKGRKSLVVYSDLIDKDDSCIKVKPVGLSDKFPIVFFSYGFKHFVVSNSGDFIIDTYKDIEKTRKEIKEEDIFINNISNGSYSDSIFMKTNGKVRI